MNEIFHIVPAPARTLWTLAAICLVLVGVMVLMGSVVRSARSLEYQVTPEGLRIRGSLYGRTIPRASMRLDAARVVDLNTDRQLRLRRRTNGSSLPGYRAGWGRLHSGEKALVFLTDFSKVLYLPTSDDYAVLLTVDDPEGLLRALRGR